MQLGDGIEFFKKHAQPNVIAELLRECTVWIDPECHAELPVWAPYTYRKAPLYNANWIDRKTNKKQPTSEGNVAASQAQNRYLGIASVSKTRPNWACCHIWGNDDESFQQSHAEVNDPRYFTCPANMVLVPSPLKTFTDTVPEVKAALRYAARLLYDFYPEGRDEPTMELAGDYLPPSWVNLGGITYRKRDSKSKARLKKRYKALIELQANPSNNYPREKVTEVVTYWNRKCPGSLFKDWPRQ